MRKKERERERFVTENERQKRKERRAIYRHRVFICFYIVSRDSNLTVFIKLFDWQLVVEQNDRHWNRSAFLLQYEKQQNTHTHTH